MEGYWLFLAVIFGYLVALALYFMDFEMQREPLFSAARNVAAATLAGHLALIVGAATAARSPEPALSVQAVAFLILLVSYLIEGRQRARFLMLFTLPLALLLCLLAGLRVSAAARPPLEASWLWLHITFILTGLAGLLVAVSSALMYLLQSSQIKSKHLGKAFVELPALSTLDTIHFRSLCAGVVLFSLGILSGLFWASDRSGLAQALRDPKAILSMATCALYWIVLAFRLSPLRRGQKIAAGTVVVVVLLLGTLASSHDALARLGGL